MSDTPATLVGMSENEKAAELEADHRKRSAFYRSFRRCGGVVSLTEWQRLSARDQAALVEASASVEAERSGLVATALYDLMFPPKPQEDPLEAAARHALEVSR